MKTKQLPPYAPTLIESTRAIGYSLEAAVADIIDNSITAGADQVDIYFFPDNAYIAILDNGIGMSDSELDTAMQYGSKSPVDMRDSKDLGRFGLGLKTASLSQCRSLTVISKQGDSINGRRWDLDHVIKVGDWSLLILDDEECNEIPMIDALKEHETGTLVVWQNLDRLKAGEANFKEALGRKIDLVRDHLSLVFHRYLSGEPGIKKLKISINGEPVVPADPFLLDKSTQIMDDEAIKINGQKIVVRPYILPHLSKMTMADRKKLGNSEDMQRQQGFYVYRNKRLLIWGTWFRITRKGALSKLARIQVDIPNTLDDMWTLDIKKSSAMPPAEVRKNLVSIVDKVSEFSERTYTYRGKKEVSDKVTHIWNRLKLRSGGYSYEVNLNHPAVEKIMFRYPEVKGPLQALLMQIGRELPLNQLQVDFNNDEELANDKKQSSEEIEEALRKLLKLETQNKITFLNNIAKADPFCKYPDVIEKLEREIERNE